MIFPHLSYIQQKRLSKQKRENTQYEGANKLFIKHTQKVKRKLQIQYFFCNNVANFETLLVINPSRLNITLLTRSCMCHHFGIKYVNNLRNFLNVSMLEKHIVGIFMAQTVQTTAHANIRFCTTQYLYIVL